MKKCICILFILLNSANIYASMHGGYRFYFNEDRNACISIRFHEDNMPEYLSRSDGLFFDFLTWFYQNKNELESLVKEEVVIFISHRNNISKQRISLYIDGGSYCYYKNKEIINENLFYYNNDNELSQNIFSILSSYYEFTSINTPISYLGLYFVWEQDVSILGYRAGVEKQNYYTEIFIGPFPGAMFNSPGLKYGVVFWEYERANNYLNKYPNENYTLEYIILSKDNVIGIFGELH